MSHAAFPPGPRSALLSYYAMRRDPLKFLLDMAREYGDIVHLQVGSRHDYLLNHPDYIREVLLAPEDMLRSTARSLQHLLGQGLLATTGDVHRRDRRALQPSFLRTHGEEWAAVIVDFSLRLRSRWKHGDTVDVSEDMLQLAQGVIIKLLMAVDIDADGAGLRQVLAVITEKTNQATFPSALSLLMGGKHRGERRLNDAIAELDRMIYAMIAERRAGECDGPDLLSTMVRMRDGAGKPVMSDTLIRDQLVTHLTAGHETVGNALAWTWHLLASHPEAEAEMSLGDRPRVERQVSDPRRPEAADVHRSRPQRIDAAVSTGVGVHAETGQRLSARRLPCPGAFVSADLSVRHPSQPALLPESGLHSSRGAGRRASSRAAIRSRTCRSAAARTGASAKRWRRFRRCSCWRRSASSCGCARGQASR